MIDPVCALWDDRTCDGDVCAWDVAVFSVVVGTLEVGVFDLRCSASQCVSVGAGYASAEVFDEADAGFALEGSVLDLRA